MQCCTTEQINCVPCLPPCKLWPQFARSPCPWCTHLVIDQVGLGREVARRRRPAACVWISPAASHPIPAAAACAAACLRHISSRASVRVSAASWRAAAAAGGRWHIGGGPGVGIYISAAAGAGIRCRVLQNELHNLLPAVTAGEEEDMGVTGVLLSPGPY